MQALNWLLPDMFFNQCVCYTFADTPIAFTAQHTSSRSHYSERVKYDKVETNDGSGYNASTGIFTAPVAGTYMFLWHVMTTSDNARGYCYQYLYKNGAQLQFLAVADAQGNTDRSDAASNSAVLTLNTGDTVSIRVHGSCGYLYGRQYTFFSGFRIWFIHVALYFHCYVMDHYLERTVSFYDFFLY